MTASAQNTVTGGKAIVFGMTALVFAMMAVVAQLPMPMQDSLLAEGGPFETLSVVGYGLCILLMFVMVNRNPIDRSCRSIIIKSPR